MRKILLPILLTISSVTNLEAKTVRALFLGNSYTDVNNLPEIIKQLALSTGDTLVYSKNTPGGYRFSQHRTDQTSLNLIAQGGWDYVILQEQSQLPSFPDQSVANQVYPHARALDSLIHISNPCATTMFYMTWGRKNGDDSNCDFFPILCTYEGMDSLLQLRYTIMAEQNDAAIAPVAKVWRYIRVNNPTIDLYTSDESHPSAAGSFAAACTFYATIFQKSPTLPTYNFQLNASVAQTIKDACKLVVFDTLRYWDRFTETPVASFSSTVTGAQVVFNNTSVFADVYHWDFGDGNQSIDGNPSHSYTQNGLYTVTLTAKDADCDHRSIATKEINIQTATINRTSLIANSKLYPNPVADYVNVETAARVLGVNIVDILGRTRVANFKKDAENKYVIATDQLSAGAYFIELFLENGKRESIKFNIVK